ILTAVSGGNANQAVAAPVVYVAELGAKKQQAMSLSVAAAKDAFFDFKHSSAPDNKSISKDLEAKVIAAVREAHRKPKPPVQQAKNDNAAEPPVPQASPEEQPDEMANAIVSGMAEGAFTAPGVKQT